MKKFSQFAAKATAGVYGTSNSTSNSTGTATPNTHPNSSSAVAMTPPTLATPNSAPPSFTAPRGMTSSFRLAHGNPNTNGNGNTNGSASSDVVVQKGIAMVGAKPSTSTSSSSTRATWVDRVREKLPALGEREYEVLWERGVLGVIFLQSETDGTPYVSKATESCISKKVQPGDALLYVNVVRAQDHTFSEFFKILSTMKKPVLLRFKRAEAGKEARPTVDLRASSAKVFSTGYGDLNEIEAARKGQRARSLTHQEEAVAPKMPVRGAFWRTAAKPTALSPQAFDGSPFSQDVVKEQIPPPNVSNERATFTKSRTSTRSRKSEVSTEKRLYEDYEVRWETGSLGLFFGEERGTGFPVVTRFAPGSTLEVGVNDLLVSANGVDSSKYPFEKFFARLQHMNKPVTLVFRRRKGLATSELPPKARTPAVIVDLDPTNDSNPPSRSPLTRGPSAKSPVRSPMRSPERSPVRSSVRSPGGMARPSSATNKTVSTTKNRSSTVSTSSSGENTPSSSPKDDSPRLEEEVATEKPMVKQRGERLNLTEIVRLSAEALLKPRVAGLPSQPEGSATPPVTPTPPIGANTSPITPPDRRLTLSPVSPIGAGTPPDSPPPIGAGTPPSSPPPVKTSSIFTFSEPEVIVKAKTLSAVSSELHSPSTADVSIIQPAKSPSVKESPKPNEDTLLQVAEKKNEITSPVAEQPSNEDAKSNLETTANELVVQVPINRSRDVSDPAVKETEESSEPERLQEAKQNLQPDEEMDNDPEEDEIDVGPKVSIEPEDAEVPDAIIDQDDRDVSIDLEELSKQKLDSSTVAKTNKAAINASLAKYRKRSKNSRPVAKLPAISEQNPQTVPLVAPNAVNTNVQVRGRSKPKSSLVETPDGSTHLVKWKEGKTIGLQLREVQLAKGSFPLVVDVCKEPCCDVLKHVCIGDIIVEINGRNCAAMGVKKTISFLKTSTKTMLIKFRHGPAFISERVSANA